VRKGTTLFIGNILPTWIAYLLTRTEGAERLGEEMLGDDERPTEGLDTRGDGDGDERNEGLDTLGLERNTGGELGADRNEGDDTLGDDDEKLGEDRYGAATLGLEERNDGEEGPGVEYDDGGGGR
jgi:hypothetical protein